MPRQVRLSAICLSMAMTAISMASAVSGAEKPAAKDQRLNLALRSRTETEKGSGRFHALTRNEQWDATATAIIVCDMWDLHHCLNATRRGAEMAPRMNRLLKIVRKRGATVIHAPSGCMAAYKNHPARKRAQSIPRSENLPKEIGRWCYKIPNEEKGVYPIDQSDGGEDDGLAEHRAWAAKLKAMNRNPKHPWQQQTKLLEISDKDYISDNGEEIWSILEQRGLKNVILLGVHTNMCVLGRPFGLRQMAKNGKNVVLMRDMTDTMYNPQRRPFVSHFTGTDLIVAHIEKWVCPTVTSDQILGGKPFRFKQDKRPRLVIIMAELEYKTEQTLPKFAAEHLGKHFSVEYVFANPKDRNDIPGLDVVKNADVLFVSVRRRALPAKQLALIRQHVAAGKPVIGIRTASHAFALRGKKPPQGHAVWNDFDPQILGGQYTGHHGNKVTPTVATVAASTKHPILAGVKLDGFHSGGSLYKVRPLAKTATALLTAGIPGQPAEPVAWTNKPKSGNRVFYTSLGQIRDFQSPAFNRFLRNAVYWAAGIKPSDTVPPGF
ncbi:MAG: ThuA domain-containing protein [Planctomycetes bacterium]|nr:ThuA domain-containing protein [Planctomycetota bacterium]